MSESCPRCGAELLGRRAICPRCLYESDPPVALIGGSIALEEEIGRGGMGSVFRARHLRLDRTVAVKFLPPELHADPEFRARFEREARILARLDHENVVGVYDFGEDEGQPYIVMEHVDGTSLAALMPQPASRAVEIARAVCRAIGHAHAKGIVHRDVKPENILIGSDGRVKVTDFGIARLVTPTQALPALTAPERTGGTPYYLAPEALDGAPPDPRMDLYSLGVVLHRVITGRLPVGDFGPLPADLDRIVRRLLAPRPEDRYASADDVERELAAARVASEPERQREDDRPWTYAVALLLTVATATALWAFLVSATPRLLRPDEVMPLVMVPPEHLPDGRVLSRARFETWPILGALATFAVALAGVGLLRFYWLRAGLVGRAPHSRIREARWVLSSGILACLVFAVGRPLKQQGVIGFMPIIGGVIEVAALFLLWAGVLQAWRNGRSLRLEPGLWVGFGLALLPPVSEFVYSLATWRP